MIAVPDDKLYILSENFYGKPTIGELLSTGVTTDRALLLGILNEMEGVSPNDVGAVASYDGSRVRSDAAIKANSLKMSSYNRLGQKVKQWTIYGLEGAPATQASFTYNVSGELSATETAEWKGKSWSTISSLAYYYDDMGRLKSVLESGDRLMRIDRTEAGLFGAEGRGAYIGATVAGIHGEVSERDGASWGFRGSVYYGVTNDGNKMGADGKHREVSRFLWIPELGSYGRFKLGASVDETNKGLQNIQKEKILEIVEKIDKAYAEQLREAYGRSENGYSLTEKEYKDLSEFLVTKGGLKKVWRPSWPWDPYHKDTYANGGLDYGNIEFKYWPGCNNVFSSYNYGNNIIDHIFLDMIGHWLSK